MTQVVVAVKRGPRVDIVEGRDRYFRIGSLTKPATAAVALELVEPDEPVSAILPDWGGPPAVTVGMLLNHSSGLVNYASDPGFIDWVRREPERAFEPEELWRFALDRGLAFPPGTGELYSTAGYIVAGRIIEARAGEPAHLAIRARVLDRLDLRHTFLAPAETPPEPVVTGYVGDLDVSRFPQTALRSIGWTGGGFEATAADAVRLIEGVLRPEMVEPGAGRRYGMGLRVRTAAGRVAYAHTGRVIGYRSAAAYLPGEGVSVAVLANRLEVDAWAELERIVTNL